MDRGGANCPLCRLFNNDVTLRAGYACHGCPVADYSGARGCSDTPYDGWTASFSSRLTPADRAVAKREYEFLKEVRDWWLKRITENREKI